MRPRPPPRPTTASCWSVRVLVGDRATGDQLMAEPDSNLDIGAARRSFLELQYGWIRATAADTPDRDSVERLRAVAASWSASSDHLYAGWALQAACHYARGDADLRFECGLRAVREFAAATEGSEYEGIAALQTLSTYLGMLFVGRDPSVATKARRSIDQELAQRLIVMGMGTTDPAAKAGFLVRGFKLETGLEHEWRLEFPQHEVDPNNFPIQAGVTIVPMPSAFKLLVRLGDYVGAGQVAQACPEPFTSYALRGWRIAVSGFLHPEQAVECFTEAAHELAQDSWQDAGGSSWSTVNINLWAKYFRARAALAEIVRTPARASELLSRAREALVGTDSGFVSPQVTCLRVVAGALSEVLLGNAAEGLIRGREYLRWEERWAGIDDEQRLAIEFLDRAAEAFRELRRSPETALGSGRLADALRVLGRIPLIGSDVADAVNPAVSRRALEELESPHWGWMYRTIGGITSEDILRKVLFRLFQARLPLYAQIRHGPFEYGTDIAVLFQMEERVLLRTYQVKAGEVDARAWPSVSAQLEQMFLVPLPQLQLPMQPDLREGVLIFNGQVTPHLERVVEPWLEEQRQAHGRTIRIMNLDDIVSMINQAALVGDLRDALAEFEVPILGTPRLDLPGAVTTEGPSTTRTAG